MNKATMILIAIVYLASIVFISVLVSILETIQFCTYFRNMNSGPSSAITDSLSDLGKFINHGEFFFLHLLYDRG